MRQMTFALLTCAALGPGSALSQAFGIEMGQKIETLAVIEDVGNGIFYVEVPSPVDKYFEAYIVTATPKSGVCLVRGIGKTIERDSYGDDVRGTFVELRELLSANYGESNLIAYLKPDALWDEPRDWTMAVTQGDRVHQAEWDRESKSSLPEDLQDIILSVRGLSSDASWIALQYRFSNIGSCNEELTSGLRDAL